MEQVGRLLARSLMDLGAVLLRPESPFTWASGWHSPIYCDNRRILSSPELRSRVAGWLADEAMRLYPEAETVAGVATGAIAHGVLAADRMGKPFVYREAGAEVLGMVAIFTYGFDLAREQFAAAGVPLTTLSNYGLLTEEALASGYIDAKGFEALKAWREAPSEWGR